MYTFVGDNLCWLYNLRMKTRQKEVYHKTIPEDILDAVPEEDEEYSENVCEKIKVERQLRKYSAMPVYGYNSGK